jgi:hypothetical protein
MGPPRHHHKRSLSWRIARWFQVLAIVMCLAAAADFTYSAFRSSDCFAPGQNSEDGLSEPRDAITSPECAAEIARRDTHFQVDAAIALLGLAILAGATVRRSDAHRRTKRLVITVEVAVVVLAIVYGALLSFALR